MSTQVVSYLFHEWNMSEESHNNRLQMLLYRIQSLLKIWSVPGVDQAVPQLSFHIKRVMLSSRWCANYYKEAEQHMQIISMYIYIYIYFMVISWWFSWLKEETKCLCQALLLKDKHRKQVVELDVLAYFKLCKLLFEPIYFLFQEAFIKNTNNSFKETPTGFANKDSIKKKPRK